jgi:MFS family permease
VIGSLSPAARRYLLYTALLTSGLAISALFFNLLLLALGYDQQSLRLPLLGDLSLLGLMHSAPVLTAALSSLPLWWLVSRYGPRPALVTGALLSSASLLGMALWPAPLSMLAWASLGGPAAVLYQVSAAPFMMKHSGPGERDQLFALSAALTIAVAGLGSLLGGLLPGLLAGPLELPPQSATLYRITFGFAAIFTIFAALPLLRAGSRAPGTAQTSDSTTVGTVPDRLLMATTKGTKDAPVRAFLRALRALRGHPQKPVGADYKCSNRQPPLSPLQDGEQGAVGAQTSDALVQAEELPTAHADRPPRPQVVTELRFMVGALRSAVPFLISPLLISSGAALLIPFLNIYFRQRYGAPDAALGLVFAIIGLATGGATLAAPLLARRLGKMGSVVLTQALAIPCLLLLAIAPSLWLAAVIALARGALMNMAAPLYDAYAMERSAEATRPMVIGLINGAFSLGYIVGPTISAQVQRDYGFTPIFLATAGFYAAAALANYLIFLHRPHSRRTRA